MWTYAHSFKNPVIHFIAQRRIAIHVFPWGEVGPFGVLAEYFLSPLLLCINGDISAIMSSFLAWMELPTGPCHRDFPWPPDTDHSLPTTFPAVLVFRKWLCRCLIIVGLKELDLRNFWLSPAVTHWLWPVIWNRFLITGCLVSSGSKCKHFHSLNYLQPCLEKEISRHQMTERNSWSTVLSNRGFLPSCFFGQWCIH